MAEIKEQIKMQFEDGLMYIKLFGVQRLLLVCFLNILVLILGITLFKFFA